MGRSSPYPSIFQIQSLKAIFYKYEVAGFNCGKNSQIASLGMKELPKCKKSGCFEIPKVLACQNRHLLKNRVIFCNFLRSSQKIVTSLVIFGFIKKVQKITFDIANCLRFATNEIPPRSCKKWPLLSMRTRATITICTF